MLAEGYKSMKTSVSSTAGGCRGSESPYYIDGLSRR
jgi:hypothetical protein